MKIIAGCLATWWMASYAVADPSAIRATAETDAPIHVVPSILIGGEAFHYAEDVQAPLKSAHDAWLPTMRLAVDATALGDHVFGRAAFTGTYAAMTYDGSTQDGAPLSGHTSGHLTDTELDVGGRFHFGPVTLGGYIGAAHHTWDRDFGQVMNGYREQYTWNYFPIALEAAVSIHALQLRAEAAALFTAPGTNHAYLSQVSPTYADATMPVATGGGGRFSVSGTYPIYRALSAVGMFSYENDVAIQGPGVPFNFNDGTPVVDSNGNALFAAYPGASTTRISVMAGASYGF
jgi:hypothetical protein